MITAVSVQFFRGIVSGGLKELKTLTLLTGPNALLTGPNGCGKSTVLDALLIATSPRPHEAVGMAVQRHPATRNGARWLVGVPDYLDEGDDFPATSIQVADGSGGALHECQLKWTPLPGPSPSELALRHLVCNPGWG